ncbi:hypothetical protein EGP98_05125 [bacterium]|nr:hypothetical protein [bacterium]
MDIRELLQGKIDKLEIDKDFFFNKDWYKNTDIIELKSVHFTGGLKRYLDDSFFLEGEYSGDMILKDSISLEDVIYHFSNNLEEEVTEKVKNVENTLDILSVLWENIVLEVPIRFSEVKDYSNYQGDGWHLVSEEEYEKEEGNFLFRDLLEEKEKE